MKAGRVRRIAAEWHSGQASPSYALASTGAIVPGCSTELWASLVDARAQLAAGTDPQLTAEAVDELAALAEWVERTGVRGPVRGWHQLWDAA